MAKKGGERFFCTRERGCHLERNNERAAFGEVWRERESERERERE